MTNFLKYSIDESNRVDSFVIQPNFNLLSNPDFFQPLFTLIQNPNELYKIKGIVSGQIKSEWRQYMENSYKDIYDDETGSLYFKNNDESIVVSELIDGTTYTIPLDSFTKLLDDWIHELEIFKNDPEHYTPR